MSQENVEILRKAIETFERREKDAWLLLHDPEIQFRADPNWPESETIRGPEAVWDFYVKLTDAWEDAASEMVEVIEFGEDKLAARLRRPVRGKASGVSDVLDYWCLFTFSRGKMLRQRWFANREKALEAARLTE